MLLVVHLHPVDRCVRHPSPLAPCRTSARHLFWSIGWPVRETQLINRARVEDDPTQPEYQARRTGVPKVAEQQRLFE
jgi:hypothetical protein